ncbi:LysM peptidoglycan-binding domain-containing protein [Allosaccharopolyspora coralli]|uniref:LysM peptidoglycan-binding domain-containing protein n=1 Tax=Allosaccharopolyspora coralli TaxID=2665642 RepID=A0A5Q3Q8Z6_9PSEU|nr:LysM peptidoglycan-binding domain-containing protein [Allosaccharopolyspora coralli]QGK70300.1 LysM peptidoglycan-binding domain-containing protein [Allosaccharopolyspora coralli]
MTLHTGHTRQLVRRLAAATGICALLVATPALLSVFAGLVPPVMITWPPADTGPFAAPLTEQWRGWVYETYHALRLDLGLSGLVLLAVLGAGWSTWAAAVWWTVCDLAALARHGAHHFHQRTGPRGWVTALLTTLVLTSIAAPAHATPNNPTITRSIEPEHGDAQRTPERSDVAAPLGAGGHPDPPAPSTPDDQQPTYRVQPGDTLTSIAAIHLGHPDHWHTLVEHNPYIDDPNHLEPGQLLTLPESTGGAGPTYTVAVQPGDTLSTVAERELGDPEQWDELFTLNAGRTQPDGLTLAHPDILLPGWQLLVPDYTPPEPADEPPPTPQPTTPPANAARPAPVPDGSQPSQHDAAVADPGAEALAATTSAALAAVTAAAWHQHHRRRPARRADTAAECGYQGPVPAVHSISLAPRRAQPANTETPRETALDTVTATPTSEAGVTESEPDVEDHVIDEPCSPAQPTDETPIPDRWERETALSQQQEPEPAAPDLPAFSAWNEADEAVDDERRPLGLSILGRLRLIHRDGTSEPSELTSSLTRKQTKLLLFVALHPQGTTREAVRAALWSDTFGTRQFNVFYAAVSQVRKALRPHLDHSEPEAEAELVLSEGDRVRLNPDLVDVDYWHLLDTDHARRNTTDTEQLHACTTLVQCYHGELAAGLSDPWLEAPREAAHRTVLDALAALAAHYRDTDPERRLHTLEHARLLDPTNEAVYRDIMRTQATLQRHESINATLHLLTTTLADIGQRPHDSTHQLADALQRSPQ